jgi:hypothetical protein
VMIIRDVLELSRKAEPLEAGGWKRRVLLLKTTELPREIMIGCNRMPGRFLSRGQGWPSATTLGRKDTR